MPDSSAEIVVADTGQSTNIGDRDHRTTAIAPSRVIEVVLLTANEQVCYKVGAVSPPRYSNYGEPPEIGQL